MEKINRCNIEEEEHMFLVNRFICTIKLQIVSYKFRVHLFCILPCEQRISEHIERDVHLLSNFNVQLNQRLYCG